MGHQVQHIFKPKRLVWVVIVVIMMQLFDFLYGGVTFSLFSTRSHQVPRSSLASLAPPMTVDTNNTNNTTVRSPSLSFGNNTFQSAASLAEDSFVLADNSSVNEVPPVIKSGKRPFVDIVTIAEMHDVLQHNRASVSSMKPRWSSTVDQELLDAKVLIENALVNDYDHTLYPLYHNISRFKR
ncbi:putative exostosin [Helianthus annuus]|nr:putative exostosin [Helianthus annuus]